MKHLLRSRATVIWLLLVSATVVSWNLGHGVGSFNVRDASLAIIVVAFLKVRFVILDFMEIRHAPLLMRIASEAWVVTVCTVLIVMYRQAPH
jgi:hypothetical protein